MKLTIRHWIGIGAGVLTIILNFALFMGSKLFPFLFGIAALIAALPFITTVVTESGREKEKEEKFLEFTRNLVESVKAGNPISRSILNVRTKDFGSLTPHIQKLAAQIALGIPVRQAFEIFAGDINNKVITRSVALITEAEQSGGQIDLILESTAKSVTEIEDLKKERKSGTYNMIVQGYIIFIIFLIIMLVVQLKFIPMMLTTVGAATGGGLGGALGGGLGAAGAGGAGKAGVSTETLETLFIVLVLVQGLFCGLVIGKLSEGSIKAGIRHSAALLAISYLVTYGVRAFMT